MYEYGQELIAAKRAAPGDDMLSLVANAFRDDEVAELSDLELYLFFSLLFSAGAETTRNSVAGGLLALIEHPEQMRRLQADRSEEHTSELQSLMRISYAVFCLKKKN